MGGKTISTVAPKIANISLQTSAYGGVLPIIYGTTRVSGNLIWYGNFTPIATTTSTASGGKGLGKVTSKNTTYTYTAAVMMALSEGTITGIGAVWKGKDKTTLSALGLTLFTGALGQAAWSYRVGRDVLPGAIAWEMAFGFLNQPTYSGAKTIGYSGTAYLAAAAYDLGADASIPNHGFEVQGKAIYGGAIADANPKDIANDFLTNAIYGAGLASGLVGSLTNYDAYCRALGLFFSPAYTEQRSAADHLKELTDASNTALVWSEGVLKFIPYGDASATGNGATYTPNLTPVYNLTDDNLLTEVKISRAANSDAFNRVQVEFLDRTSQYNTAIVTVEDQAAIEKFGLRPGPVVQAHMIADPVVAKLVAQIMLQRNLYKRNTYSFSLGAAFALLEPMDLVTLTTGDMANLVVRITAIDEDGDDFAIEAEDYPQGIATAARYAHDSGRSYQSTPNQVPAVVNAPAFFELPPDANSTTGLAIAIAVGGQTTDVIYGGCRAWVSLDGTTYREAGILYGSSRYGALSATYAAATGLDATNTLGVTLASTGQMLSGSAADAANMSTLIAIDSEFVSYTTATLTGTLAYDLTSVQRGQYATTGAAHASGAKWARIDEALIKLVNLDLTLITKTIYFKFTAFNAFGSGEQDLSAATAYTYAPTGYAQRLGKYASVAFGADVTAANTAAAIAGQGALATINTANTANITAQAVTNVLSVSANTSISMVNGAGYTATGTSLSLSSPAGVNTLVLISAVCTTGTGFPIYQLVRTQSGTRTVIRTGMGASNNTSFAIDAPSSGAAVTYSLEFAATGGSGTYSGTATQSIVTMELKR